MSTPVLESSKLPTQLHKRWKILPSLPANGVASCSLVCQTLWTQVEGLPLAECSSETEQLGVCPAEEQWETSNQS